MSDATGSSSTPITDPVTHFVEVQYDPVEVRLLVEEASLVVRPGDRIGWVFRGVPDGWTPWISAEGAAPPSPFEVLSQSPWGVRATIDSSMEAGSFGYRATLQRGVGLHQSSEGLLLRSAVCSVAVQTAVDPQAHRIVVSYHPASDGQVGSLIVTPQLVTVTASDAVVWDFTDLASDLPEGRWIPRIDFVRFHGPESPPNLHLGPFAALTYESNRITAMGNSRTVGVYNYACVLVGRFDGSVIAVSSTDPVIDRRGDPSGG